MEDQQHLEAQPAYRMAIPLFLATCIPYFGAILYEYSACCGKIDEVFIWFGGFYGLLGTAYLAIKYLKK